MDPEAVADAAAENREVGDLVPAGVDFAADAAAAEAAAAPSYRQRGLAVDVIVHGVRGTCVGLVSHRVATQLGLGVLTLDAAVEWAALHGHVSGEQRAALGLKGPEDAPQVDAAAFDGPSVFGPAELARAVRAR